MPARRYDGPPYPVSDLDAAKRWLWTFGRVHEWLDADPADLPPVARLVCDVFWVSPEALLRDLRKDWRQALGPVAPPRDRRHVWGR